MPTSKADISVIGSPTDPERPSQHRPAKSPGTTVKNYFNNQTLKQSTNVTSGTVCGKSTSQSCKHDKETTASVVQHDEEEDLKLPATPHQEGLKVSLDRSKQNNNDFESSVDSNNAERWDAFAALQENLESSDESDTDDRGEGDNSCNESECASEQHYERGPESNSDEEAQGGMEWNANYVASSSSEEDDSSDDEEELTFAGSNNPKLDTSNNEEECVDLMDSDEENDYKMNHFKQASLRNANQSTTKQPSTSRSRLKKTEQPISKFHKSGTPIELDGDSDSSIEEVTSRRLPSPSARPLPPWQRSTPAASAKSRGKIPTQSATLFDCMNCRNDVLGGSGAGVNGFSVCSRKGEEEAKSTAMKGSTKRRARQTNETSSKTATNRKRKGSTAASTSASAAAPAKKRRKSGGRRYGKGKRGRARSTSTARRNATTTTTTARKNDAWSARERGVRQPYYSNNRGGASSGSFRQEKGLGNLGGASMTL